MAKKANTRAYASARFASIGIRSNFDSCALARPIQPHKHSLTKITKMSSDSGQEDYEPWSDDDDEQQAPARPAAPEALDAETLAALNALDGETLAGQLWDVLGGLAVNCARGDATAQTVAARARAALTPREYAMALQPELTRCGEQATWCWLVDELHACLERVTMERAHSICLLYTSPSPRDQRGSRMPSSA